MSFWDDVTEFGSNALETAGEGLDTFVKTFAEKEAKEKSANPDTHPQQQPRVQPDGRNAPPVNSGAPMINNNTLLIVGGVVIVGFMGLMFLQLGRK